MTDGGAGYPATEIAMIKRAKYIQKIEFLAVGFGHHVSGTLGQIANAFPNGKKMDAKNVS